MSEPGGADVDSLDTLFTLHRAAFIKMAEKIIGCRSQAEDIVHDAFVKIIAGRTYEIESRAGYLMKIVRNLAIDRYRRKFTELRVLHEKGERVTLIAETPQPDSINMHRQTLEMVASALSELPARTRTAFEMHRIEGMSQKDVAVRLGVSPTLVNFMIRDALVHCRRRIQAEAD